MTRKRYNGHLEDMNSFNRRKFCSLSCANKRQLLTKHGYSWRARKHLNPACEACGYTKKLQAHHIDQDKTNNVAENIQTLCKHCHDFWHTTANRIGRQIAGRMPALHGGITNLISEEWLQGWPIGWTNLKPSATAKSPCKPPALGACWNSDMNKPLRVKTLAPSAQ